jgi:AraC family transcriptional regulator
MELAGRESSASRSRGEQGPLLLAHDMFFGDLRACRSLSGITLSHRVANSPPEDVKIHTHAEAHFVLVTGGHYVSSARAAPNPLATVIFNPPGTTHRDHFHQGRGSFFTISIAPARLVESLTSELPTDAAHLEGERACGLAQALLLECGRWNSSSPLKAESLYLELLSATSHRCTPAERWRPAWLRTACEMIQDCDAEKPSVASLAAKIGVHPVHLARTFRAFLGCTPGDLLRVRRLERASDLLLRNALPIIQIALECGFSDQAQFTKAFRQLYGITPANYRRRR